MKFVLLSGLTLLLLSGCAEIQRAGIASRAQTEMVGISRQYLFYCAGVPMHQERVDDLEFLSYSGGGDSVEAGTATATSSSPAVGVSSRKHRYCDVTFVLKDGKVSKISYSGRTGGLFTRGEQCAFIVENCISTQTPALNQ